MAQRILGDHRAGEARAEMMSELFGRRKVSRERQRETVTHKCVEA